MLVLSLCNLPLTDSAFKLAAVHLVDSFYCSQAATYAAAVMTSLATMIKLELPHINVLSKIDLIESMGELGMMHTPVSSATCRVPLTLSWL